MDDDEALARQLQTEFDKEEEQERQDEEMARALAAGHSISDSDSESDGCDAQRASESTGLCGPSHSRESERNVSGSDSDATYIEEEEEEEEEERNSNNNRPGKKQGGGGKKSAVRKRSRRSSESEDSDVAGVDEGRSSGSGAVSRSREKEARILQSTKRLKRGATETSDGGECSGTSAPSDNPDCPYGSKCYRKNPKHLKEFSHSGKKSPSKASPTRGKASPSTQKTPLLCPDVIEKASPYGFVLTKVTGIASAFNNSYAVHIQDILHPCMGQLVASAHFNYMFDIPWLMDQYPKESRKKPLLLIHGEQREGNIALHEAAHAFPNIKLCQARLEMMYGTHHSKMMFLLYTDGMRIVIHTSNIIEMDWHQKTQGVWISPLFPKLPASKPSATDGDSATFFKRDLLAYLAAYRSAALQEWKEHITRHDMSQAKVFIIGSVPGRHVGESKDKWGHMKVRKVLLQHGPEGPAVRDWPVIGQFSSVGSLGPDKGKWLCAEWLQSLSSVKGQRGSSLSDPSTRHLKLIFPSSDNVRTSLEGYPAGGSLPYSIQTAKKQPYLHTFFHQWKASATGRSRASPHIKTYSRLSPDNDEIPWFICTSANLSKAAWGALEKNGSQLMIRSYEIGVLMLPKFLLRSRQTFPLCEDASRGEVPSFRLPWDVPLTPYGKGDRPWLWDIPYTDKPDSHGNAWVPGRR